ncbi:concanavalin A-like lectin/glucanase domain-containing protein [Stachybotrys elegans]|uniref:Concanavalin A-like lectin/glucanase domain-containing protein n=1 Tax=Stachybotrys elegans TaxID=80388 RepID=A0A8K0SA01_9HYPO|nr:concanavalin A-like lectin/glucanase domain-containing protein [Stachybotrys elegans]
MHPFFILAAFVPCFTLGWESPQYRELTRIWQDNFVGTKGHLPNLANWNIIDGDIGVNNELQIYTTDTRNIQLSGGDTLQLVPWKDEGAPRGWTSGRVESIYTLTPLSGKLTRIESVLRFGSNSGVSKQGLWPAFWMLGSSIRQGISWPFCGEIDIMENINGELVGHGTLHFESRPGISADTSIPDQGWHTWRVEIDRRPDILDQESIAWFLDDSEYHRVHKNDINDDEAWERLAHSPFFLVLNMAVGGNWPGNPNDATQDGYGSMVEYGYVAHYSS